MAQHPPKLPNIQAFEITLLVILLRNICDISLLSTGWNVMPKNTDNSCAANIVRIKLSRNDCAHADKTSVLCLNLKPFGKMFVRLWLDYDLLKHK